MEPGRWKISSGTAGALVEIAVGAVVLGAELDPADVAHAGDPAVGVGLDDDVLELARVEQPAQGLDVELEGARARGTGGWLSTPDATWTFCARSAATTSPAVRLRAATLLRVEPDRASQ